VCKESALCSSVLVICSPGLCQKPYVLVRMIVGSRVHLLLLDSSPDPKLVFLDNGKLSMEINLAEPVEPFCKNRPNICFGWWFSVRVAGCAMPEVAAK
jgi:hypothetical protein